MSYRLLAGLALLACLIFGGCGGTPVIPRAGSVVIQQNVGVAGGTIQSADATFRMFIPAGNFTREVTVTVEIFNAPLPGMTWPGWDVGQNPVRVSYDVSAMATNALIGVQLDLPHELPNAQEDYLGGMSGLTLTSNGYVRSGNFHAIEEVASNQHTFTGSFDLKDIQACQTNPAVGFLLFSAARPLIVSAPPFVSGVFNFNGTSFTGVPPSLTGKRVAILVHGIETNLADLVTLAQFISTMKQGVSATPYYDAVIGFQYTSNAPLAVIGKSFADLTNPVIAGASQADVYAHSMGNVVARYGMETTSLANRLGSHIAHFVGLAGPHTGVPFGALKTFRTMMLLVPSAKPCMMDLLTNGVNGPGLTSFLADLNPNTHGADWATSHYYTMSGNDFHLTVFGISDAGDIVNYMYHEVGGPTIQDDGLVAVYSAQAPVLAQQSMTWTVGPTLPLNHTQQHSSPVAFNQIQQWVNGW